MMQLSSILVLLTTVVSCIQGEITIDNSHGGEIFVVAPNPLNLSCHSPQQNVKWTKDGGDVNELGFARRSNEDSINGKLQARTTISKDRTNISDSGIYKCSGNNPVEESSLSVKVIEVTTITAIYNKSMHDAVLGCNIKSNDLPESAYTLKWMHGKDEVTNDDKYEVHDNGTITIKDPKRDDTGEYQCVFTIIDNQQVITVPVHFFVAPYVRKFDKSKNLIQGDPLTLRCNVIAHPPANITWYKDDKPVEEYENIQVMDDEDSGLVNGKLRIDKVEFEDKGDYMCIANSSKFSTSANSTILVRVKDKLAALWPFLGIVAEVIVLCIIIFIYEKKRSKTEEEDDTADAGNSANAADHKGDVRQRNVKA